MTTCIGVHKDKTNAIALPLSQVLHMYMKDKSIEVDNDAAVKLECLELRRFYKDMPHIVLKKREIFTILE